MNRLSTTFFSFILIALFSSSSLANTVRLANGEWAPYQSKSLKHGGYISHLVTEAFAAEGYNVEFVYLPWKRGFEQTQDGELDGSFLWSRNEERAQHFFYSDKVLTLKTSLFQRKGAQIMWSKPEDLAKYAIGGVIGYAYGVEDLEKQGVVKISRISDADANYKKLAGGRLDIVLEDSNVGQTTVMRLGLTDQIEMNDKPIVERDYFLIVPKKSPRAQEILDAFNRGLAKVLAEGKLQKFEQESIKGNYQ
ncbi:transporter substrate-binding domain-containing protein [Vibrio navarrensis]